MAREAELVNLTVHIDLGSDADADELDQVVRRLSAELLEAGAEAARPLKAGPAPAGAKSGEALVLGALSLTTLAAALPGLLVVLTQWAGRNAGPQRRLTISQGEGPQRTVLELDAGLLTEAQLHGLLDRLLSAPAPSAGGVSLQSGETAIGGHVIGRDQITQTVIHAAPGATIVVTPAAPEDSP